MMREDICALIDDDINEAQSIATILKKKGFPFEIMPIAPSGGDRDTSRLIEKIHPRAAMIDFTLDTMPPVNSRQLAHKLIQKSIQTVFVTKDRDIADQGEQRVDGVKVPVYSKRSLYQDPSCMEECIRKLGGRALTHAGEDYGDRLAELQDRQLLGKITAQENRELAQLKRKLIAEEREEARRGRIIQAESEARFQALMKTIRKIAVELEKESRRHQSKSDWNAV